MRTRVLAAAVLPVLLLAGGCSRLRGSTAPAPGPATAAWSAALTRASAETTAGRYAAADRALAEFAAAHPDAPQSGEAAYWRALFKLDPANTSGSPREAIALLDGYVSAARPGAHRTEALALRRLAVALETRAAAAPAAAPAAAAPAASASRAEDRARDEEIARLKDELQKANAELERIRRRLATPRP